MKKLINSVEEGAQLSRGTVMKTVVGGKLP